jgi:signal peptidase
MADINIVVVMSLVLFSIFAVLYLKMNRGMKFDFSSISKKTKKKNFNKKVELKVASWRGLIIPPKKFYPFLPLIPFFIIVFIFMNHMIFFAVITSDSMSPTFEKGDIVLMQTVDKSADENDIIMFSNKNPRGLHPPVIHRVNEVKGDNITTKSDATDQIDDWVVQEDEIQAKAVTVQGEPIVLENVGSYFITDYRTNGKYANEFVFTSLMIASLKDLGIAIFVLCVGLYIVLTVRDIRLRGK